MYKMIVRELDDDQKEYIGNMTSDSIKELNNNILLGGNESDDCLSRASNGEVVFSANNKDKIRDVVSILNYMDTLDSQNYSHKLELPNTSYFMSEVGGRIIRYDSDIQNKLKETVVEPWGVNYYGRYGCSMHNYIGQEVQVELRVKRSENEHIEKIYYLNGVELLEYVESYGNIELIKLDGEGIQKKEKNDTLVWTMKFKQIGGKRQLNRIKTEVNR